MGHPTILERRLRPQPKARILGSILFICGLHDVLRGWNLDFRRYGTAVTKNRKTYENVHKRLFAGCPIPKLFAWSLTDRRCCRCLKFAFAIVLGGWAARVLPRFKLEAVIENPCSMHRSSPTISSAIRFLKPFPRRCCVPISSHGRLVLDGRWT